MLLFKIIFIIYILYAIKDIKKAIIAWIPVHLLFNAGVLVWSRHPLLPLSEAVSLTLPFIFLIKGGFSNSIKGLNNERFLYKGAFIVYFLSYLLSTLVSNYNSLQTILFSVKFFVDTFLLTWIFQKCLTHEEDFNFLINVSIFIIFLIVGLAISEVVLGTNIWQDYIWSTSKIPIDEMMGRTCYLPSFIGHNQEMRYGLVRCYSFFNLHLRFGSACAILLCLFGLIWRHKYKLYNNRNNIILTLSLILLYAGVFLSNSKGPILFMIVISLIIFTPKQIFDFKVLVVLTICIFILLAFFPGYLDNLVSLTDEEVAEEGGGSSVQLRMQQLDVAIRLFENNPLFGSGPQSLRVLSKTSAGEGILGAESVWLKTLPERGLFGVFAYLWWYCISFVKFKRVIPAKELMIIMGGLLLIETTNGMRDTLLYAPVFLAIRKFYMIKKRILIN